MCILSRELSKKKNDLNKWFRQMIYGYNLQQTGVWWQIDGFNILNCDF